MKEMNGFLRWFKSTSKMKRWMFLILLGAAAVCYAIANIITMNELSFGTMAKVIVMFALGCTGIIVGMVFKQKRTLEILVQDTDKREKDDVTSLIFNKKVYDQGPKIVVIGGGSGLNTVLRGLKKYTDNITAIVTVSDYGEQSSDSRKMLQTLPLDDIKESLVALSSNDSVMEGILNYKFPDGKLKDLSLGDIYLLAMQKYYKDFSKGVEQTKEVLNITGKVLPVTMEEIKICAELEDGTVIQNRSEIPEIVAKKKSKISRIYITPTNCRPAEGVIEAIQEADAIVIGPGSLYTNVIPNLLVKGVTKAIRESKGFKVYVSNIMTEPGQTYNYSLADHIRALKDHTGGTSILDYCIYDTGDIVPEFIRKYNMEGSELVAQDIQLAKEEGVNLIRRDLATIDGKFIRHNPDAIASTIIELVCEELKFQDRQNDPQYLALNDRLKDMNKLFDKKPKKKTEFIKTNRKKSKFLDKYEERMNSIKECDTKSKKKSNKANQILGGMLKVASKKEESKSSSRASTTRTSSTGRTTRKTVEPEPSRATAKVAASRASKVMGSNRTRTSTTTRNTAGNVVKDDTIKMQFIKATQSKKDKE